MILDVVDYYQGGGSDPVGPAPAGLIFWWINTDFVYGYISICM